MEGVDGVMTTIGGDGEVDGCCVSTSNDFASSFLFTRCFGGRCN